MIEQRADGSIHIDPEDRESLERKYRALTLSRRKRLAKTTYPTGGMFDGILWAMCRFDPDPIRATQKLLAMLASGELQMTGRRVVGETFH